MSNNKNKSIKNFIFKTESESESESDNNSIYTTIESFNNNYKNIINENSSISSNGTDINLTHTSNSNSDSISKSNSVIEYNSDNNSNIKSTDDDNLSKKSDIYDISENGSEDNVNIESDIYNTEYQDQIYNKYMKNSIKLFKFADELKDTLKKSNNIFENAINKNIFIETKKCIDNGSTIYCINKNKISKICSTNGCTNIKCEKKCYTNTIYKSLRNFNRGIKTIYNILFKLLLVNPVFRNQCKCCENKHYTIYLLELEKNFNLRKNNLSSQITNNNFDQIKILELQINYHINKFMNIIGMLDCECKFKDKYLNYYPYNYLNFSDVIKIYTKTIPQLIKLLKTYYDIKDNHEELYLIDNIRCIHEDIRYNNLTYCLKKKYPQSVKKNICEYVMRLDLINDWMIESIKISILMYNQQSLEHFIYTIQNKPSQLLQYFDKIYQLKNEYIDLNYNSNKNNMMNIILDNYTNIDIIKSDNIVENIIKQLEYRNKFNKKNINEVLIEYILNSILKKNIIFGFKFLKYIIKIKNTTNEVGLENIFNCLLNNDILSIDKKISYLKIINKNKINIIEYDFVNKLIDIEIGDKIILEFNKEENTLFNIKDYKNENYIGNIIKKCIVNKKVNIIDYVLFNLNSIIENLEINPILIYLTNIKKKIILD